ncbi:MAG TPA: YbaK/EbsC family protein [archaeon]|nr:YbaK/EbsC family protein [archaeon]
MDLHAYLKENNIWHRFIEKQETIHTADASSVSGIDIKRLTKALVLLDENKSCILAIIPGDCKLSFSKLKEAVNSKSVFLVKFENAEQYSGYPPGATPMVHHKTPMKTVIDKKLASYETIYGGGGTRTRILELRTEDVIRLNNAGVADIVE